MYNIVLFKLKQQVKQKQPKLIKKQSNEHQNTKYILVKGINGFGNMISSLNFCYHLAINTNRKLVIDWKNSIWNDEFDNYFIFNSNIYVPFTDFITQQKSNTSVYPSYFINNLTKEIDNAIFVDIKTLTQPLSYIKSNISIIVLAFNYHCIGFQSFNLFWNNISIIPSINSIIQSKLLELGSYKAIHIRNSDQLQLDTSWIISFLLSNKSYNIYVATDDINMVSLCKQHHDNIFSYTTFYKSDKPMHYAYCSDIYKKNCDVIVDLYLLANSIDFVYAEKIVYTKTKKIHSSSYSILAKKIFDILHKLPERDYNYVSFKPIQFTKFI